MDDLGPIFDAAAREWNVDPRLLRAVSSQESGGNSTAISRKGAQGLMQITPDTQRYLGITDPNDPQQSIFGAAKYLSEGLDKEKSPEKALLYYHGGPGWRNAYGPESAAYVPGVTKHYQQLAGSQAAPKGEPVASSKYDDFLKRTGAGDDAPAAAAKPDYTDFLKRTGAAGGDAAPEAGAVSPSAPAMLKPGSLLHDLGRLVPSMPSAPAALPGGGMDAMPSESPGAAGPDMGGQPAAMGRIGQAVSDAWHGENPLMSPKLQGMIEGAGPVGNYVTSPLLQAGGAVLRGGAALGAGASAVIGEALPGGLGRDANMLAQVAPFAGVGTGAPLTMMRAPEAKAAAGNKLGRMMPAADEAPAANRLTDAGETRAIAAPAPTAGGDPNLATVTTGAGRKVDVRYEVVPASDLTAASGDLQPRERGDRLASAAQIQNISANLDPARLMRAPEADRGAPIVGPDGVVESGNGRVQGIMRAAKTNPEAHAAYIKALQDAGYKTDGIDNPVLVARRVSDMTDADRRTFVQEANQSATARLSAGEQARVDAQSLSSDMLGRYDPSKEPTAAANSGFLRDWVATLPEGERNAVMDANGELSSDGLRRLSGAMLARAYGDDKGILARGLESTDDGARSISGALTAAAPAWARLRAGVESGAVPPEFDVSKQLAKAADIVRVAREKGHSLDSIVGQQDAFNPLDPVTTGFVKALYSPDGARAASRASIADTLQRYADEAARQSTTPSMFGDAVTPQQALDAVMSRRKPIAESAGAAAAHDITPLEQAQETAYRSVAEKQKLLEPQQPEVRDNRAYVPGVSPNQAEVEQSVNTARELKALNITHPDVSREAKEVAAQNNDARQRHFEGLAGSDVDVMNAKAARAARAERDLAAAWANKLPADVRPVVEMAEQIKESPDGRRPIVREALDAVTREMSDSKGNPIKDPQMLYGVRKHLDDLLSKEAASSDPKMVRAAENLQAIKAELDKVIETAAPGFKDYLKNFSEASRPIDAMQVLQKHEGRLYDAQNRMSYAKVQTMMRQITEARRAPGINPYKSIPDETMAQLWNLRDDLRRSASAQELARTPGGSDTAQNAWDVMKQVAGGHAARGAAHVVAAHSAPVIGNLMIEGANNLYRAVKKNSADKKATARGMELLHPKNKLTSITD